MLSPNVETLLTQRYYKPGENWDKLTDRVVNHVCKNEDYDYRLLAKNLVYNRVFIPNSPCLVNAGTKSNGLFACFVVGPTEDTLEDGFNTLRDIAFIAKRGGGCGFTGSVMRPANSPVAGSAHGYSYGPNRFAELVSYAMDMMTQSGFRKMALMYTLDCEHPDIEQFIYLKQTLNEASLYNFNQSVTVSDEWMERSLLDGTKESYLFHKLAEHAWTNGDPAYLFTDTINQDSPYRFSNQRINCTNPSLRKGTLILTEEGIYPIEELENKKIRIKNLNNQWSNAECFLSGQDKQLYKVNLSGGVSYYATAEHKWPTLNDGSTLKKTTIELQVGDILPVGDTNISDIKFGDKGDSDDGFLIGWLYGDGCVSPSETAKSKLRYRFVLAEDDVDAGVKLKLEEIIKKKFNKHTVNWVLDERNTKYVLETSLQNYEAYEYFESFGVNKKIDGLLKGYNIYQFSKDFLLGFLDGLISSDGFICDNNKTKVSDVSISFSTKYIKFHDDIQNLLGFLGCKPRSRIRKNSFGEWLELSFVASNFTELTLSHETKSKKLKLLQEKINLKQQRLYRKIVSVEKTDLFEDVWDISVYDETHCFTLSNIVTGNCGEQPLPPYGSCNLGSIDISNKMFFDKSGSFDFDKFSDVVRFATRFLDNVGTMNEFPTEKFAEWYDANRPVGVGIMGLADALLKLKLEYGKAESIKFVEDIGQILLETSYNESERLGVERGVPTACILAGNETGSYRRNITTISIAPTGSIAFIAEASHGIEPIFSPTFKRVDERGQEYLFQHPLRNEDYFVSAIGAKIPTWKEQIDIVVAIQNNCDSGVSKTINLPNEATVEDVKDAFTYAWRKRCKGVTVYRDGSRQFQILNDVKEEDSLDQSCKNGVCTI